MFTRGPPIEIASGERSDPEKGTNISPRQDGSVRPSTKPIENDLPDDSSITPVLGRARSDDVASIERYVHHTDCRTWLIKTSDHESVSQNQGQVARTSLSIHAHVETATFVENTPIEPPGTSPPDPTGGQVRTFVTRALDTPPDSRPNTPPAVPPNTPPDMPPDMPLDMPLGTLVDALVDALLDTPRSDTIGG